MWFQKRNPVNETEIFRIIIVGITVMKAYEKSDKNICTNLPQHL